MGALTGIRVIELAGMGPAPFACMILADHGAEIIRVERPPGVHDGEPPLDRAIRRGRATLTLDLKTTADREVLLHLVDHADVFVEGFRPGVMERLGLGPAVLAVRRPELVFARATGWGPTGPYALRAGHDINYLAISGVLGAIGREGDNPVPPLNLLGDYGGGGMYLAFGIVAALLERGRSNRGQVVESAMTDGSASLFTSIFGMAQAGHWRPERGSNLLDSGCPYYDTYQTADDRYIAIGAIEPEFFGQLMIGFELPVDEFPDREDPACWPAMRTRFAAIVKTRTRASWEEQFADLDACVTAVLTADEAPFHPQMSARATYLHHDGVWQPAPAPRLSRTPAALSDISWDSDIDAGLLMSWGLSQVEANAILGGDTARLIDQGVVR